MTIRDDLADVIAEAGFATPGQMADTVLNYLGRLDPDADPELIAWHLRNDRAEIARLRAVSEPVTPPG